MLACKCFTGKSVLAISLLTAGILASIASTAAKADDGDFYIKPYVQLGDHSKLGLSKEDEELVWFTRKPNAEWKVEVKTEDKDWDSSHTHMHKQEVFSAPVSPLYEYTFDLHQLPPGKLFDYRVIEDGSTVFSAWSTARKAVDQSYSFAVFGDTGAGSVGQKGIALHAYNEKPDFIVVPGDITYDGGLFHEYMSRFFPVFNNDSVDERKGVPLLRSILTVALLGNHDIALGGGYPTNFSRFPDALAYYIIWQNPLNGPVKTIGAPGAPICGGETAASKPFLKSVGAQYPRMNMFSFDYGNSHWLVLDGNLYMNWTDDKLRKWVEDDLTSSNATWKFVTFHEPGFSEDAEHSREQRMRLLSDIFQKTGVDVVFAGHAHNYQRSYPLLFQPVLKHDKPSINEDGTVPGEITLDKEFDGIKDTVPKGVLYIVTGAGGAHLYPIIAPKDGKELLYKSSSDIHSFTRCKINGGTLSFDQISENGQPVDHFSITKK
ncbi:MAG TPA: metallophosphoesterase [Planktothrix sp.]